MKNIIFWAISSLFIMCCFGQGCFLQGTETGGPPIDDGLEPGFPTDSPIITPISPGTTEDISDGYPTISPGISPGNSVNHTFMPFTAFDSQLQTELYFCIGAITFTSDSANSPARTEFAESQWVRVSNTGGHLTLQRPVPESAQFVAIVLDDDCSQGASFSARNQYGTWKVFGEGSLGFTIVYDSASGGPLIDIQDLAQDLSQAQTQAEVTELLHSYGN